MMLKLNISGYKCGDFIVGNTYDFTHNIGSLVKLSYVGDSKIDKWPIFQYKRDLNNLNTHKVIEYKDMCGRELLDVCVITPLENQNSSRFLNNKDKINDILLKNAMNQFGFNLDDIDDDDKVKSILRQIILSDIL